MEKDPKKGKWDEDFDPLYDVENIVSATEFTGMMPAGQDMPGMAANAALFAMHFDDVMEDDERDRRKD